MKNVSLGKANLLVIAAFMVPVAVAEPALPAGLGGAPSLPVGLGGAPALPAGLGAPAGDASPVAPAQDRWLPESLAGF